MAAEEVFTEEDEATIKAGNLTRYQQCDKLLEILPRRGAKAYVSFKNALQKVHPHLANLIKDAGK